MIYEHNVKIDIPVFKIDSKVAYQTVRRPTVFEKSVLQLFAKHSEQLGDYSLEYIAKQMKVNSVFFVEALRYLSGFKAVEFLYDNTISDGAALKCNDILITTDGREFLAKNALPSKSKNTTERTYYHPLSGTLIGKNQIKIDSYPDVKCLPSEGMGVMLSTVEPLVDEKIHLEWEKRPNERVKSIESVFSGELRDRKTFKIDISHNGNVVILSNDNDFSRWIEAAEAEYLWQFLVSPTFTTESSNPAFRVDWRQVRDLAPIKKTSDLIVKQKPYYLFSLVNTIKTDDVIIVLDPSEETTLVDKVLTLKESPVELDSGVDALIKTKPKEGSVLKRGLCEVSYRGQPRLVDLALLVESNGKINELEHFLLTSNDINIIIFSAVICVQQAIERLPSVYMPQVVEYYEKMKKLNTEVSPHHFRKKAKLLRSKEEVVSYAQLFNEQNIQLDALTPECAVTLINNAIIKREPTSSLSISKTLAELADVYTSLRNKTGQDLLSLNNFDLLKLNVARYKLLHSLHYHVNVFREILLNPSIFSCSDLAVLEDKLTKALAHFSIQYADPQKINKRIIIIDTNCLMHSLHLLDKIKHSDELKIPVTVTHELDRLKNDKNEEGEWTDTAKRARAAINRLNELNSYEPSHIELVEKMDRSSLDSPDIHILSVAVYFRLCNSLLLTDDKNLRNMANAEGIVNKSTQEYLTSSAGKQSKKRKRK
ncbi:hypothetical protein H5183_00955 [Pseudoalteromonas sp. SR44-8]|uniref:PIN domain-containing protein n=1 Tax=Pseudoalteromonas sp. SR44-8 TaxID=2760933 RepID=UPI0016033915|nr:PIN domain-containing protein [Pseudoalteromonas sp. SR44-8]MBB1299891.1 hypothetical protein [Pseudoalteromonas sp. SR44-8]